MRFWTTLALGVWVLAIQSALVAAPTTGPSVSDLQADFDLQKYAEVVRKSTQILQTKPDPAAPVDRVKVLELQAEAHVRLKHLPAAAESFAAAAKASGSDATAASNYRANSNLMRKSNAAGKYIPKPPVDRGNRTLAKIEPIDVVDPVAHKQAMSALLTDETGAAMGKIAQLKQGPLIPGIKTGLSTLEPLRDLEQAASGSEAGYRKMIETLAQQSAEKMDVELKKMDGVVDRIDRLANQDRSVSESVDQNGVRQTLAQKRGLGPNESAVLNEVAQNCSEFAAIAESLGTSMGLNTEAPARGSRRGKADAASTLASVREQATQLQKRAADMLGADYTSVPVEPYGTRRTRIPGGN